MIDEATVLRHAEAHGRAVQEGDLRTVARDLAEEARAAAADVMREVPSPVTEAEVLSVEVSENQATARIRYAGEGRVTDVESRWVERDGRPVIVGLEIVS